MSPLDGILDFKTEEFKKKSFVELKEIADKVQGFKVNYKNQSFVFEVHIYKVNDHLKVMVECARDKFFLSMFGKHKYFLKFQDDQTRDIGGDIFWS